MGGGWGGLCSLRGPTFHQLCRVAVTAPRHEGGRAIDGWITHDKLTRAAMPRFSTAAVPGGKKPPGVNTLRGRGGEGRVLL